VLECTSWKPKEITSGLIDTETGLIYRYPSSGFVQALFAFIPVAFISALSAVIVMFGLALVASAGEPIVQVQAMQSSAIMQDGWNYISVADADDVSSASQASGGFLIWEWMALLVGIIVHVVVAKTKQQRQAGNPLVRPMRTWLSYLSLRTSLTQFRVTVAFFVFFPLLMTVGVQESIVT